MWALIFEVGLPRVIHTSIGTRYDQAIMVSPLHIHSVE